MVPELNFKVQNQTEQRLLQRQDSQHCLCYHHLDYESGEGIEGNVITLYLISLIKTNTRLFSSSIS